MRARLLQLYLPGTLLPAAVVAQVVPLLRLLLLRLLMPGWCCCWVHWSLGCAW